MTPGLDAACVMALLARLGSIDACLDASPADFGAAGVPAQMAGQPRRRRPRTVDAGLRWLGEPGHTLLTACDPNYPASLRAIPGAPVALFVLGDPRLLGCPQLAIVGSRGPTPVGREAAFEFAASLVARGLAITSGLAAGIDAAAHRGALAGGGRTVAVCGTGLDQVYPAINASLAEEIAVRGALVSELLPGTPPRRGHFPRRNRLISGLSLGVLVVEAAFRSGSLITARLAADQGREVFALPGSIHNPMARGCHRLIRDGARLVESPAEILEGLQTDLFRCVPGPCSDVGPGSSATGRPLDRDWKILLNACGFGPVDPDSLVARTGFSPSAVASMLLMLELRGEVESYPGGKFCRLPARRR